MNKSAIAELIKIMTFRQRIRVYWIAIRTGDSVDEVIRKVCWEAARSIEIRQSQR